MYHIIVNPASGHRLAPQFVEEHVIPALKAGQTPYKIWETQGEGDARRFGPEILADTKDKEASIMVIIAGGDGTAHELIEGLVDLYRDDQPEFGSWELIPLPLGTANALHSSLFPPSYQVEIPESAQARFGDKSKEDLHKLASLISHLTSSSSPKRLPVTLTTMGDSKPIPSHIVLSTSLHAALLSDSEALRESHPGIERFKIAAAQNLPVAFPAIVGIQGEALQYSPTSGSFVQPYTTQPVAGGHRLEGPFGYLVSSTIADRFEPTFVVAPTLSSIPQADETSPTIDLIIYRPTRDPVVAKAAEQGEEAAASARATRLGEIMGWVYKEGKHVSLTYSPDGRGDLEEKGQGEVVVEVFRCAGFDWEPIDPEHQRSHLICADGAVHEIPKGGKASVRVLKVPGSGGFFVRGPPS